MEDNNNPFVKITSRAFAVIFTFMFMTTLLGIIFKGAVWHIPTLFGTGAMAIALWSEKEDEPDDNTEDNSNQPNT